MEESLGRNVPKSLGQIVIGICYSPVVKRRWKAESHGRKGHRVGWGLNLTRGSFVRSVLLVANSFGSDSSFGSLEPRAQKW